MIDTFSILILFLAILGFLLDQAFFRKAIRYKFKSSFIFLWICFPVIFQCILKIPLIEVKLVLLLLFTTLVAPSLFAQLFIALGFFRLSYYLGRISLYVHRRDSFGGALFYGFKAANNCRNPRIAYDWLLNKFGAYDQEVGSSALYVYGFLKSRDWSTEKTSHYFILLKGASTKWLNNNVARYAYRFLLARAAMANNWNEIIDLTKFWRAIGSDPMASWVECVRQKQNPKLRSVGLYIDMQLLYLFCGMPKIKIPLEKIYANKTIEKDNKYPISRIEILSREWASYLDNIPAPDFALAWKNYRGSMLFLEWNERISQLNLNNIDRGLALLSDSIEKQALLKGEGGKADDEQERLFLLLNLQVEQIKLKINSKNFQSPVKELGQFLTIFELICQLQTDHSTQSFIYLKLRTPIYFWVANLYQYRIYRGLAFLMCCYFEPLCDQYEDNDHQYLFYAIKNEFWRG